MLNNELLLVFSYLVGASKPEWYRCSIIHWCEYMDQHICSSRVGRTSSMKHVKKFHSILRYAESSQGFTEIKQVSTRSIKVWGSVGFNACNTFVLRVEHPFIVRKSEKSLDMGELTFHTEKTAC